VGVDCVVVEGDFVLIDFKVEIDGEEIDVVIGVLYEIGSKNMFEGFDEVLVGMSVGEIKMFIVLFVGGDCEG